MGVEDTKSDPFHCCCTFEFIKITYNSFKRRQEQKTQFLIFYSIWEIIVVTSKRHNLLKNGRRKKFKKGKCISETPWVQRTNRFFSVVIQTGDISLRRESSWKLDKWKKLKKPLPPYESRQTREGFLWPKWLKIWNLGLLCSLENSLGHTLALKIF